MNNTRGHQRDTDQEQALVMVSMIRYLKHEAGCTAPHAPCKCGLDLIIERMLAVFHRSSVISEGVIHAMAMGFLDNILVAKAEKAVKQC